jgi:GntR family transcriptional regulator
VQLDVKVSVDSTEPLYQQIKEQLRTLILSGKLEEGSLMPSNREFASSLSCSVITIRRVYQDLETEGLLRSKQGVGTYVVRINDADKARFRSEKLYRAFRHAVETGVRLHCSVDDMRRTFDEVLRERDWTDMRQGEE